MIVTNPALSVCAFALYALGLTPLLRLAVQSPVQPDFEAVNIC